MSAVKRPMEAATSGPGKKVKDDAAETTFIANASDNDRNCQSGWARPAVPAFDRSKDAIAFQQLEIDTFIDKSDPKAHKAVIRMYGVTEAGNSVMCHVHGFQHYFYVQAPPTMVQDDLVDFKRALDAGVRARAFRRNEEPQTAVVKCELTIGEPIYGFHGNTKVPFIKVTMGLPRFVPSARAVLTSNGFNPCNFKFRNQRWNTFECNLDYELRFMIDHDIVGGGWVEAPGGTYQLRTPAQFVSTCQLEMDVPADALLSHPPEGEWLKIAPLRVLSFDIECAGRPGVFPDPAHDPVIQIANFMKVVGESGEPAIRNVFVLDSCSAIMGAHVMSFQKEGDLLAAWSAFIRKADPDVITGYNIVNFDTPYLIDRAHALKVNRFAMLGRMKHTASVVKDTTFSSKQVGSRESKSISMPGRVQLDMFQVIQRDFKLRSYTLNAVSAEFLEEQKEDVHHSIISDLHKGDADTRRRLAVYCLKDAYLPMRLMDKLMVLYNYVEMARVTGVPVNYLVTRGQQIKVVSQLYRHAKKEDLRIPFMRPQGTDEKYEGATVIEPIRGYYDQPIATLDFSSLYPSIMMAHNLCYSTLVHPRDVSKYPPETLTKTPHGDYFVKADVRHGLLPRILDQLLSARKRAKADMKKETDPFRRAILDGRQLALKVSANSVYGFTGATVGRLPCLAISSSVTAFGRTMIEKTKSEVEKKYTKANGYAHDAVVVYGDTDSVMVKFGVDTVEKAMDLGKEAAEFVTAQFIRPINLEFEKVYFPYLLINKKRYAGLYWTRPDKWDKVDMKGLETVRRDNCKMVSTTINTCLRTILIDRDVPRAIQYAKDVISDVLLNSVDMSQLVISKALSRDPEAYDNKQAHVELVKRMRKRDPGSAPAVGERVPYVIIQGHRGAKAYEKAEDPIYVLEHNLPIDSRYYLDQQLAKPLMRIFGAIMDRPESLLSGEHTRSVQVKMPKVGGLFKFANKVIKCAGCRAPLAKGDHAVCKHCKPTEGQLYQVQLQRVNDLQRSFSKCWSQCQACSGSLHQDVLCAARDCPIFYRRKKVQKDLKEAHETLGRFDYTW